MSRPHKVARQSSHECVSDSIGSSSVQTSTHNHQEGVRCGKRCPARAHVVKTRIANEMNRNTAKRIMKERVLDVKILQHCKKYQKRCFICKKNFPKKLFTQSQWEKPTKYKFRRCRGCSVRFNLQKSEKKRKVTKKRRADRDEMDKRRDQRRAAGTLSNYQRHMENRRVKELNASKFFPWIFGREPPNPLEYLCLFDSLENQGNPMDVIIEAIKQFAADREKSECERLGITWVPPRQDDEKTPSSSTADDPNLERIMRDLDPTSYNAIFRRRMMSSGAARREQMRRLATEEVLSGVNGRVDRMEAIKWLCSCPPLLIRKVIFNDKLSPTQRYALRALLSEAASKVYRDCLQKKGEPQPPQITPLSRKFPEGPKKKKISKREKARRRKLRLKAERESKRVKNLAKAQRRADRAKRLEDEKNGVVVPEEKKVEEEEKKTALPGRFGKVKPFSYPTEKPFVWEDAIMSRFKAETGTFQDDLQLKFSNFKQFPDHVSQIASALHFTWYKGETLSILERRLMIVDFYMRNVHHIRFRLTHKRDTKLISLEECLDMSQRDFRRLFVCHRLAARCRESNDDKDDMFERIWLKSNYSKLHAVIVDCASRLRAKQCLSLSDLERFECRLDGKESEPAKDSCTVCQTRFEKHELVRKLPCGHRFHVVCIDRWCVENQSNCPNDRMDLDEFLTKAKDREKKERALKKEEGDLEELKEWRRKCTAEASDEDASDEDASDEEMYDGEAPGEEAPGEEATGEMVPDEEHCDEDPI